MVFDAKLVGNRHRVKRESLHPFFFRCAVAFEELLARDVLLEPDEIDAIGIETLAAQYGIALTLESPQPIPPPQSSLSPLSSAFNPSSPVRVLSSYNKPSKKRTYDDFVAYFRHRFAAISAILRQHQELLGVTSISRIQAKRESEKVAIIGMIVEKNLTKNKNIVLRVEDTTGEIVVIVSNTKPELLEQAHDLVLDETIGILGRGGGKTIFADRIVLPDVPLANELKKAKEEQYLVIVGDVHIGGKAFLKKEFETMLGWLDGHHGTPEQRAVAKNVRYLIFTGDLVEGVGVYPGQEADLEVKDITKQYEEFTSYARRIPQHIQIIICPGNHDAGRIAEPQPPLYRDFAKAVYDLPNVTIISSPGMINIASTTTFSGFNILLYHGYSLIYYAENVKSIRNAGGQKATDRIMRFLLQRRHLAPTHGSNLYIPDNEEDPLVISKVPDFFITGHIHRVATAQYRNVTLINASCWTEITEDQEKRGLEPQPGRLPVVNLRTREIKVMNFYSEKKKEEKGEAASTSKQGGVP